MVVALKRESMPSGFPCATSLSASIFTSTSPGCPRGSEAGCDMRVAYRVDSTKITKAPMTQESHPGTKGAECKWNPYHIPMIFPHAKP